MRFRFPYEIEQEGDTRLVWFPDVPGASTQVDQGEDFEVMVRDCLVAALGGCVELEFAIPQADSARGRPCIVLDVITSAKLALAATLAELGLSKTALARRLGVTEKVVRRLLDLDHASRIERLEQALGVLDRRLEVSVRSSPVDPESRVGVG